MENIMHIQNIVPVQPSTAMQGGAQSASPLAGMQPGDTLSAQVQDVNGTNVTLTLPDGSQLVANSEAGQTMRPMDSIQLQMQASQNGTQRLQLISINNQPVAANVSMTDLALMNMRLPASRINLMAANLFNRLELPASPAAFARFAQLIQGENTLNPAQAALLAASDVPLTQENIQAFVQFLESPAQADGFAAALKEALAQPAGGGQAAGTPAADGAALAAPGPAQAQGQAAPAAPPTANEAAPLGAQDLLAAIETAQNALQSSDTQAPQTGQTQANSPIPQTAPAQEAPAPQTVQPEAVQTAPQGEAKAAQPVQAAQQGTGPQAVQPQPAQSDPIPFQAQSVGEALRSIFPKLSEGEGEALGKALQRSVPELASRLSSLAEAARSAASPAAREAAQLGGQVVQQLQFGSEMHSLYYTQIPFRHQDREQSAELYVLKRRGSASKIDEGNATVALCLETNNMGRVESLLQVRQQELSFNFRVETAQVRDFMRTQLDAVARLPFPAQYRYAGSTVCLQEAPLTPMNAAKTMRDTFGVHEGGLDISV